MLTDEQWAVLKLMVEVCRPKGKTPPEDLRRTVSAIVWRHENGAKWRAIPADYGPWWRAAQLFIRRSHHGAWERLLVLVQQREVKIGLIYLDGTSIQAQQKPAGAAYTSHRFREHMGTWADARRSHRAATRRRLPAPTGSTTTATSSSGYGRGLKSGAPWRPSTKRLPQASPVCSTSPLPPTGSSDNRP